MDFAAYVRSMQSTKTSEENIVEDQAPRSYVRIDKAKLTPRQRELWDKANMDDPPPRRLSQRNIDEHFRYICEIVGDPIRNQ